MERGIICPTTAVRNVVEIIKPQVYRVTNFPSSSHELFDSVHVISSRRAFDINLLTCHVTSSITWPYDSLYAVSYRWSLDTFLPRDASAERGYEIACRPSVCLSVTFRYRVQIRWNSSKIISRPNSLGSMCWLTPNIGDLVQREHPQNWGGI